MGIAEGAGPFAHAVSRASTVDLAPSSDGSATDSQPILDELAAVSDQLSRLPPGATEERARLVRRRTELQAQAAQEWGRRRPRDEISAELRHVEGLLDHLLEHGHVNPARQSGGGAGGGFGFTTDAWKLNRQIDESHDRAGLERRIRELREELAAAD